MLQEGIQGSLQKEFRIHAEIEVLILPKQKIRKD